MKYLSLATFLIASPALAGPGADIDNELNQIRAWQQQHDVLHAQPPEEPPEEPPVEPDPPIPVPPVDPPEPPVTGDIGDHVPVFDFGQIPGSSPLGTFYFKDKAIADLGPEAGTALCEAIHGCWRAKGILVDFVGMATTDTDLYFMAGGGHSAASSTGVMRFSLEDLRWHTDQRTMGPVSNPEIDAQTTLRMMVYWRDRTAGIPRREAQANAAKAVTDALDPTAAARAHEFYSQDTNGDGFNDDCLILESGPMAAHTWASLTWIRGTTKIFWMGHDAWCLPTGELSQQAGGWVYDIATATWEMLPEEFQKHNYFSSAVWDPISETLYTHGKHGMVTIKPAERAADWKIIQERNFWSAPGGSASTMAVYQNKLYLNSGYVLQSYNIAADGTLSNTAQDYPLDQLHAWPTEPGWSGYTAGLGMAVHEPTGRLVFWDGRHRIQVYDPGTGTVTRLPQTCNPSEYDVANVYNKWAYLPEHDAFIGVSSTKDPVVLYRLPDFTPDGSDAWLADQRDCIGAEPEPPVEPEPPIEPEPPVEPPVEPDPPVIDPTRVDTVPADMPLIFSDDIQGGPAFLLVEDEALRPTRCLNAAAAVSSACSQWPHTWYWATADKERRADFWPEVGEGIIPGPKIHTDEDGNKSVRMTVANHSDSGSGGEMQINVVEGLLGPLVPMSYFAYQYDVRYSCEIIYSDCDPNSENFKKTRRGWDAIGGGITTNKSSIIDLANVPGAAQQSDTSTVQEIVLISRFDHILFGYHDAGWFHNLTGRVDPDNVMSTDQQFVEGGLLTCPYYGDPWVARGWGGQADTCFFMEADEWITLRVEVTLGAWQHDRAEKPLSRIRVLAARRGEPLEPIMDLDVHLRGGGTWTVDGEELPTGYAKMWLLPFTTGKDPAQEHDTGYLDYDNIMFWGQQGP